MTCGIALILAVPACVALAQTSPAVQDPIPVPPVPMAAPGSYIPGAHYIGGGDWTYPTSDQMVDAYPKQAEAEGKEGKVSFDCQFAADGTIKACIILSEDPEGFGFGQATIDLFIKYCHVDPASVPGGLKEGDRKKFTYNWLLG